MEQYKITEWAFSKVEEQKFECPPDGPAYLKIEDARFEEESMTYKMRLYDLNSNSTFELTYWLLKKDSGQPNRMSEGTLISLGKALFGRPVGVPHPRDVIGGVVIGHLKASETQDETGNVKRWPRCYKFEPVPQDIAASYSDIAQYFV